MKVDIMILLKFMERIMKQIIALTIALLGTTAFADDNNIANNINNNQLSASSNIAAQAQPAEKSSTAIQTKSNTTQPQDAQQQNSQNAQNAQLQTSNQDASNQDADNK